MARNFFVNGEVSVRVKGAQNSPLGNTIAELGLCSDSVTITPNFRHMDVQLDAWGGTNGPPNEIQWMLADVAISLSLVHYDPDILNTCLRHAMGGRATIGLMARAGTRLGNSVAVTAANNLFVQLYLSSPIGGRPWYFPATYLTGPPVVYPIGVERSIVQANFRAIPYAPDPAGTGYTGGNVTGAQDVVLWDNTTIT